MCFIWLLVDHKKLAKYFAFSVVNLLIYLGLLGNSKTSVPNAESEPKDSYEQAMNKNIGMCNFHDPLDHGFKC